MQSSEPKIAVAPQHDERPDLSLLDQTNAARAFGRDVVERTVRILEGNFYIGGLAELHLPGDLAERLRVLRHRLHTVQIPEPNEHD